MPAVFPGHVPEHAFNKGWEWGGDKVTASVVTADGSLVEEYTIDKKSGVWTPVR